MSTSTNYNENFLVAGPGSKSSQNLGKMGFPIVHCNFSFIIFICLLGFGIIHKSCFIVQSLRMLPS